MDIWKRQSRLNILFATDVGSLSGNDLWHLPLIGTTTNLNDLAKELNKIVNNQEEEDFVTVKKNANTLPQLRLDLVKDVIAYKLALLETNEKRQKTQQRNERIKNILANKEDEELQGKSIKELNELMEE
jgi:hypothetical protein